MQNVPIESIKGNERNPRKLDKEKFAKLVQSIKDFPEMLEKRPIVIADGIILGGNMRHKAAIEAGLKEIPIIDASEWTEEQRQQFIIKDNLSFGEWDWDILANEWDAAELEDWGLDVWQPEEEPSIPLTDANDIPEIPKEAITQAGDLYILGNHRLLCGDSTNADDVARLMDGKKADLCFTSPPYGQQRDYGAAKEIVQDWNALMLGVFANLHMKPDGQVLVNLGLIHRNNEVQLYWEDWIEWMQSEGWRRFGWYVWDSGYGLPGDWMGRFAPSFEFVFHFNKEAKKPAYTMEKNEESIKVNKGKGLRDKNGKVKQINNGLSSLNPMKIQDSVIRAPRSYGNIRSEHPATFSVEFAEVFIQSWNGLVYEPFLGSGTTMIAAEKSGQPCYGMELDPKYCDVIVKRWEDFTGKKAERVTKT
jgi:DNA modification methylase